MGLDATRMHPEEGTMQRAVGKAERLLQIEALLLTYPEGLSQAEIARRTGVHRSTIMRSLPDLTSQFAVHETDEGWLAIDRDHYLMDVKLTLHEAMAVHLAARLMATRSDKRNPHAAAALRKLGLALEKLAPRVSEHLKASAEVMEDQAQRHDPVYLDVLETLTRAWSDTRVAHLWHRMPDGKVFDYDFAPYFIEPYAVGQTAHVIGWREPPGAVRTLKLERIQRIELTDMPYEIPETFDPRALLADAWGIWYSETEPVEVVLRFHPRVAHRVRETQWHRSEDVAEQADGSLVWRARVAEPQEMVPWIRGWGADVEVLEPEGLREALTSETRKLADLYHVTHAESDPALTRLLRCWGKTGPTVEAFHPALFHMLDVGHVAQALLQSPASPRWRNTLAKALDASPETLVSWLPYLVAMHDIAKISASFQSQRDEQLARLQGESFPFGSWRHSLNCHHSLIGLAITEQEMSSLSLPKPLHRVWGDMIGGHHGQFHARGEISTVEARLREYEPPLWRELRSTTEQVLRQLFLDSPLEDCGAPSNQAAATMALTGFTILCDWLGSDERFFQPCPDLMLEEYVSRSRRHALRAVREAGFSQPVQGDVPMTFAMLFPDKPTLRPLQAAIDRVPQELLDAPCLAIIEAPTGEGKTEAALALAHRLAQPSGSDELYYALPTTATSNQMFGRVQQYLLDCLKLPTQVELIHGQAHLVQDDLCIVPMDNADRGDQESMVKWFTSNKRAVLAPFGVGTIDQAELAALNVKHSALRLVGLAGKTVIFDEVHAYDTYMTTIVERLLHWLSALGTSVIILSATLPQAQRAKLARAYGVDMDPASEQLGTYPGLWILRPGYEPHHASPPAYQPNRRLDVRDLHIADDAPQDKARWLLDITADGGCACWITNTVARAQELFRELRRSDRRCLDLALLHARFPLEDRQTLEQELARKYGPKGERPTRGIVIGTQVLEQSLDLDFDVMVSDLAPIDLLLQRSGRLQRHTNTRPAALADHPTLWINTQLTADGTLSLEVDRHVYDEFLLRKTWRILQSRKEICLPQDYRGLVEAVYGIDHLPQEDELWEMWDKLRKKQTHAQNEAEQRLLPGPDAGRSLCRRVARLVFEEDETGASWVIAQTRLGRESVNLIPLERRRNMAYLYPLDEAVNIEQGASPEMQLRLLRRHVRVSRPEIVQALKKTDELSPLFKLSPRLKGYYPLWLSDGRAEFPSGTSKLSVTLETSLGLVIRKEKGV
jgi:CRISPR-associated endonuclease/helicase Cas3